EAEFEVRIGFRGDEVSRAAGGERDGSVLHLPLFRGVLFFESTETVERFSVEDQFEAVRLFLRSEGVRFGCGERKREEGQNGDGFHEGYGDAMRAARKSFFEKR